MVSDIDDKVLIAFSGCGGNTAFFFGVADVISRRVDMSKIALLSRSASGFPEAACISGYDVKMLNRMWVTCSRSYFNEEGGMTYKGMFDFITKFTINAFNGADFLTTHHVALVDPTTFKRMGNLFPTPRS